MLEPTSPEGLANKLGAVARETLGACLATGDACDADPGVVATLGRSPYPSVRGNPPIYRNRPFFDARRVEGLQ